MPASQKITKDMILNLSSNQDVYERGERYYRDGKLLSYNATEDTTGETAVRAIVEGNYKNYEVSLKLDIKQSLVSYLCSCESHSIWRGACKHVVTALLAYVEGRARTFSAGKMREHAHALATKLEEIIFDGIDQSMAIPAQSLKASLVKLVPTMHCTARGIYLTFTVGRGRMYIVKSIAGFVNACKNNEKITYGQGLTFVHQPGMFDEKSQELLDFVTREDDMYFEMGKRLSRQFQLTHPPLTAGRELHLTRCNIDDFFSMFAGEELECFFDKTQIVDTIKLRDEMPPFSINVRHLLTGVVLHSDHFEYRLIRGRLYYYILANGGLYRLTRAEGRIFNSLFKAFDDTPSREILLTGHDRQKFLTVILPQLMRMGVIALVEGDASASVATPLFTKMYFDSDKKDIVGRVEFHYGSVVIDALHDETGEDTAVVRDIVAEYRARRQLLSFGFYEDKAAGVYRLRGDDMLHSFLHEAHDSSASGIESLRKNAEIFVSEDLQKKTIRAKSPQIGLRLSGDLLKLSMEDSDYEIGELIEALEAYRTRKKFHRLKDGRFLTLDDEPIAAAADFLDQLDVTRKEVRGKTLTIPAYRALYVDDLTRQSVLANTFKIDQNFETLLSHFKDNAALDFKVPRGLSSVLREYQKVGFSWLKTLAHYGFGGILADDMGLGKTLQLISVLAHDRKKDAPSIVVCPTSLLFNWENEISRFMPRLRTMVVSGLPEKRRELLKTPNIDVFITTYDMLKRDVEHYSHFNFAYIIADEAQNIKNPGTQAAKSLKELKGKVRFALTGTPIENTLTELWSIFDFIMPGYLYSAHKFSRLYETPIIKNGDANAAVKLRKQIAPFVLRRVKSGVLTELPEKIETTLQAELLPEQKKIYHANLMETIGTLDDIVAQGSFADNRMRILAQLTRLRQICCHPGLFLENYDGGSGKLNLAIETIQRALESGHRVLLFSQFTSMLQIIKNTLDETEITIPSGKTAEYFYLDGTVKAKERMEMTERFNAGEKELFLISLKAGGAGLNLTGADVVIHYDPWWNPSVMDQASDRAHRYGQKKVVQVFNMVAKDSIEEKIMKLQDKKRGLIDSVITEGGSFINLLSEEEVRKLFSN